MVAKAIRDLEPYLSIVALLERQFPGMDSVISGILDDAGIICAPIQAVPDIYAVGKDVGIRGTPGDVLGIANVPLLSTIGGCNGKTGVNCVIDNWCAGAMADDCL